MAVTCIKSTSTTVQRAFGLFDRLQAVEIQGEGEPLLSKDFFAIADEAAGRGAKLSLITNGSLMSAANIRRILERPFEKIAFSLESPEGIAFAKIRGGSLKKVIDGIRRLKEARDALKKELPMIGLAVTVLKSTVGQLEDIVSLYRALELDGGISFQGLQRMTGYAEHYPAATAGEMLTEPELRKLSEFLNRFYADQSLNRRGAQIGFYPRLFAGLRQRPQVCPWLTSATYISAEGEVMPCCHIKDTQWSFGNVVSSAPADLAKARKTMANCQATGATPTPCAGCWVMAILRVTKAGQAGAPM
ncbi:MAG: radical SAM/SPASM domain-containing protein [Mesorhizobium sp.]|uniref:radical SAM protein n=1 Tax=Mesorhizobium sp. TaxID=1871066 RepID=UPI000FE5029A|nr:radical SAM protein [Mesorhizobium sp.]RWC89846.1 MAG: radical SAM/SPASM domain-containing protein [Mesorhizobium sp.]